MQTEAGVTRREFLRTTSAALATAAAAPGVFAAGTDRLRIGVIGCGARGTGAAMNCVLSSPGLEIAAIGDVFSDRVEACFKRLKDDTQEKEWSCSQPWRHSKQVTATKDTCFTGFDAYAKVLASGVDLVILAGPPHFRPAQLKAAIEAGKHVFMEKPVAVDPPGARLVIASGEKAAAKKLSVVAGTQRRHDANYLRTAAAIQRGAIGKIVGGTVMWCGGALWFRTRNAGESDAEYMVRNWVSFTEMSGDHIVEQHVHNIDVANWFIGRPPVTALGFGGRARRRTGNQFDFFSVDFDYGDGCHIHSMCRQVNGTYSRVGEFFTGTEGVTFGNGGMKSEKKVDVPEIKTVDNPYVEEHVALLKAITTGQPVNEARQVAESTMAAIMGRISTYTGQLVRWSDVMEKQDSPWFNFSCQPTSEDFEKGPVVAPADDTPSIPGKV
jgi:predicted dehydrogenase